MAITIASIRQLPGIIEVTGDLPTMTVVVEYVADKVSPDEISQAIKSAGYGVTGTFQPEQQGDAK